jgi:hypothetical protein
MSSISAVGVGRTDEHYFQLSLHSQSQLLREKIKEVRTTGTVAPETIQRIESHLSAMSQEKNPVGQWNSYELAYENFIPIASRDDLLGVFLRLRARTHRLDEHSQKVWPKEKIAQIEEDIRSGEITSSLRAEIVTLVRTVHECGLRRKRESEARSRIVRLAFFVSAFLSIVALILVIWVDFLKTEASSPWLMVLTGIFGAIGGLLSETVQLRSRRLEGSDLQTDGADLLFRGALGAIAAVVVGLFLRLRIVDFPFLHGGTIPLLDLGSPESGTLAPAAFYFFGFASGITVQLFFRTTRGNRNKDSTVEKSWHENNDRPSPDQLEL